jgi:[1-hydroxy-2-(trimethylamino)ethyl]phosphonate dioxygenase
VSQLEHALQAATLAERDVARPTQVTAALLHDIGHLVDDRGAPVSDTEADADMRHEERAARYLARWFGSEVIEPIRLHVPAKRFLVATDPAYRETLSPASVHSLELQGGPMSAEEANAFVRKPYAAEARGASPLGRPGQGPRCCDLAARVLSADGRSLRNGGAMNSTPTQHR